MVRKTAGGTSCRNDRPYRRVLRRWRQAGGVTGRPGRWRKRNRGRSAAVLGGTTAGPVRLMPARAGTTGGEPPGSHARRARQAAIRTSYASPPLTGDHLGTRR